MSNDLISRQAAIDAVHNYWKAMVATVPTETTKDGTAYDTKLLNEILVYNKKLVGVIKAIPPEAGKVIAEVKVDTDEIMKRVNEEILPLIPKWIPVTERLPEVDKRVVVSVSGKNDSDYQMVTVGSWSGVTNHGEPHFYGFGDSVTVTAWMPLPEPYKEADR